MRKGNYAFEQKQKEKRFDAIFFITITAFLLYIIVFIGIGIFNIIK